MRIVILATSDADLSLATALAAAGRTVHVLRPIPTDARPPARRAAGVTITSVGEYPPMIPEEDAHSRTLQMNLGMLDRAAAVLAGAEFDLLHVGGSELVHAGTGLARLFHLPLVSTLAAPRKADAPWVRQMTWWLAVESTRVIVRSRRTARALVQTFAVAERKVAVVGPSRAGDPGRRARSIAERVSKVHEAAVGERGAHRRADGAPDARMLRRIFERDDLDVAPAAP